VASTQPSSRRGAVTVFIVAGIVLLLAMVMLSVDVASMQLVRTELRAASDAAAKAGAEALLRTQDQNAAVQAALAMAELNSVGGRPFKLSAGDVVIGTTASQADGSWAFSAGGARPNAVRVNSAMNAASASGPVTLAFGKVFKAGTFTPSKTATASAIQQEVCLAIDRSGSMSWDLSGASRSYPPQGAADRRPKAGSRWLALTKALDLYLSEVQETAVPSRLAMVTWASDETGSNHSEDNSGEPKPTTPMPVYDEARLEAGLSLNFNNIENAILQRSEHPLYGSTNMSAGIDRAVAVLTSGNVLPYAQRTIVLMTDGQWNKGRNPRLAAEDARNSGIVIHVVTFLPEAQNADAEAVASITGGTYIHANNEVELIAAFEKLARTLPVVLTD
jgi:Mg-chelatase subunit ChlD